MVAHGDGKKDKAGAGRDAIDPARSEERSWIQARAIELVKVIAPDGNGFTSDDWSRCYKQAKEEWEKTMTQEKQNG